MRISIRAKQLQLTVINNDGAPVIQFASPGFAAEADVGGVFAAIHAVEALLRTQRDHNALGRTLHEAVMRAAQGAADGLHHETAHAASPS